MLLPKWKTRLKRFALLTGAIFAIGTIYALLASAQMDRSEQARRNSGSGNASSVSSTSRSEFAGDEAPDFTLKRMNGETFTLSAHRGEVVVVNFWATWCPPCRKEIPGFIKLQKELKGEGLTFVGVSLDQNGFEAVRPYAEKMGINYPLVVDDGSVSRKYGGVRALPTTFVVAPDGTVAFARPGFMPEQELRTRLKPLLKRAEPAS